jgi:hypothetical protein
VSPDESPEALIAWRLRVVEEAVKFQTGQIDQLRDRINNSERTAHEQYVTRAELSQAETTSRDVWTLRILVLGQVITLAGVLAQILVHAH